MTSAELSALFQQTFGAAPSLLAVAPGRVNLIGEHTDYNDGFVFPAAIDRQTWVAAAEIDGPSELVSVQLGAAGSFDASRVQPGELSDWAKYPAGMAWALTGAGHQVKNIRAVVASTIPMGSGVSSSAALEMAFGVLWNQLGQLGLSNADLAKLGKVCENQFVGVNSGIMDQMASAMGKDRQAMFLDTRSLEIQYAPIPFGLSIVLCDTKKPRALTDSAYNERRSQCESAAAALGVSSLRDATMPMLEAIEATLDPIVYKRARHVISENDRCLAFRSALEGGDLTLVGKLMHEGHASLRDDYAVSCTELDSMEEAAEAAPGCIGARMTGAGFGGACVALVRTSQVHEFCEQTLVRYRVASGRAGEAMACEAVEGARILVD